jgi:RNA polymerase sigma-70 factor (ECF subfamily)
MRPDFAAVYEEEMSGVYAFFVYRTGSVPDAEDLTQRTFERALRAWERFDPGRSSARTWLLTIGRNLLIDHYRATAYPRPHPLDQIDEVSLGSEHVEPDLGIDPVLADALATLSARDREIIALRFGADLAGPEIAVLTGLQLGNVQQILSRSLRRLRQLLDVPTRADADAADSQVV